MSHSQNILGSRRGLTTSKEEYNFPPVGLVDKTLVPVVSEAHFRTQHPIAGAPNEQGLNGYIHKHGINIVVVNQHRLTEATMPWDSVTLNDGNIMPGIAYGTWREATDLKTRTSVDFAKQAIAAGIYHVDTAQNYTNEAEAGIAIRECGLPREQIFITTKFSKVDNLDIPTSFRNSLKELGLSYIDLYLIHWPQFCEDIPRSWKEMEKIKDSGLAKSIGVSNFKVEHLDQVFSCAKHIPAVNQIRFHPDVYKRQIPILELCQKKGIIVEGYSPLEPARKTGGDPLDKTLKTISERVGTTVDQILLAWAKAKGIVPVTMSTKKDRLEGYVKAGDIYDIDSIDKAGAAGV